MFYRSILSATFALLSGQSALAQRGGVNCDWVGLTESYPIIDGTVLSEGNRDSGCDSRGESGTEGFGALPQKRRVLQFLKPDVTPEDLYLRIGKSMHGATTLLRFQSIELREQVDLTAQGHRARVAERPGFVTLSTHYPLVFLTYVPGPGADPVVTSMNVASLYGGDHLQLKVSVRMAGQLANISVQSLGRGPGISLSTSLGPVFPEIWQAESPSSSPVSPNFRVRLCISAGLRQFGPCALPSN